MIDSVKRRKSYTHKLLPHLSVQLRTPFIPATAGTLHWTGFTSESFHSAQWKIAWSVWHYYGVIGLLKRASTMWNRVTENDTPFAPFAFLFAFSLVLPLSSYSQRVSDSTSCSSRQLLMNPQGPAISVGQWRCRNASVVALSDIKLLSNATIMKKNKWNLR